MVLEIYNPKMRVVYPGGNRNFLVPGGIVLGGIVFAGIVIDGKFPLPFYSRAPVYLFRDDVLTPSPSFIPDPTYIPDLCVAQVKPYLRFPLYKLKTVLFLLISSSESSCVSKCEEFYTRTWKTHVGPAFIILGELIKDTVMYTCP